MPVATRQPRGAGKAAAYDVQLLASLRWWWGYRAVADERIAYDAGTRNELDARLDALDLRLKDPALLGHPKRDEAEGRRQALENWAITIGGNWLRLMRLDRDQVDVVARGLARQLSAAGREGCRLVGWPDEICDAGKD